MFFADFSSGPGGGEFPGEFSEGFPGGFPGGFPFRTGRIPTIPRRPSGPVNNSKFYKILGVDKDADENEIKKAYKKKALKEHPDRGGDESKFKEIARAYEVLSNPDTKKVYDEYGEEFLEEGGMSSRRETLRKTQSLCYPLKVKLEDLYNGKTCHLAINRKKMDGDEEKMERKLLEVNVEKGMRDGQKITFAGEANESPGMLPGDVHFVLSQQGYFSLQ